MIQLSLEAMQCGVHEPCLTLHLYYPGCFFRASDVRHYGRKIPKGLDRMNTGYLNGTSRMFRWEVLYRPTLLLASDIMIGDTTLFGDFVFIPFATWENEMGQDQPVAWWR